MSRAPVLTIIAAVFVTTAPAASAQKPGTYQEISLESVGEVTGRVVFEGDVPEPLQLLITKDMEICGIGYRERREVDTTEDGGLRSVAVYIEKIDSGKPWSMMQPGTRINQKKCSFQPHVQVVRRGAVIDIVNSDSTLHNIHAYELIGRARRSLFNISQPEMGPIPQDVSPRRGHHVSLECDSHDFMQGWIFAADHPYATLVDDDGRFSLSDIPPGTYVLSAWHPRLGVSHQKIVITANATSEVHFTFSKQ